MIFAQMLEIVALNDLFSVLCARKFLFASHGIAKLTLGGQVRMWQRLLAPILLLVMVLIQYNLWKPLGKAQYLAYLLWYCVWYCAPT